MNFNSLYSLYQLLILLLILPLTTSLKKNKCNTKTPYNVTNSSTADIIRLRGYIALDHYITTPDGYIFNIVQALNPLINHCASGQYNKDPVLFVHGLHTSSKTFVVNSVNVRPKNYGSIQVANMTEAKLKSLLINEPASKSLVFTLLNFGHQVWLVNLRGTQPSQRYNRDKIKFEPLNETEKQFLRFYSLQDPIIGNKLKDSIINIDAYLNETNKAYWNFSLDVIAENDLVQTIDYVLQATNRKKLSLVSHSNGATLALMLFAKKPKLTDKVSRTILWAPALHPVNEANLESAHTLLQPAVQVIAPDPLPPLATLKNVICSRIPDKNLTSFVDYNYGPGGGQVDTSPDLVCNFDSVSTHMLAQILQATLNDQMRHFDYLNSTQNLIAYGQTEPPIYDISKISSGSFSLWAGGKDNAVPLESVVKIASELGIKPETHYLNQTGLYFNHVSYMTHKNVFELVVVPSLKYIES